MRDWLAFDGEAGYCPDWYPLYQAAEHLHVAPWDLGERDPMWAEWARRKMEAEGRARAVRQQLDKAYSS